MPEAGSVELRPRDGFDDFFRREYRPLLRLGWSLTGRHDVGEELVQDVMLTVHERWDTVGGYQSPGGFARRVLLNDAASFARRRIAERRALDRSPHETTAPEPQLPPGDDFWSALRALPERQAQAVSLHYLEDRSVADIAEILGVATNTVKVHLHRGRLALAKTLTDLEEG